MCFVSFIPKPNGYLLGSNRDEFKGRIPATSPLIFNNTAGSTLMPVDGKAGGTWIGLRSDKVAIVLLNGAFENHIREASYRHSRGLIIPEILKAKNPDSAFEAFPLENIEPFTLITVTGLLIEWRWDGKVLHRNEKDTSLAHCWSSATLYDADQQSLRKKWFTHAVAAGVITDAEALLRWQSKGGYGPKQTDIALQRPDGINTVSTTVVSVFENTLEMYYEDYLSPGMQVVSITAAS